MNQLTTTGGSGMMMPTDALSAMSLAKELANARLVPQVFQKSPADIFLVMGFCNRFQLDFFMTIQEVSVIKGKLFVSGKLTAAILHASGQLAERLNYEYSGEGDARAVRVIARLNGETEPRHIDLKLKDARTENDNWRKQPDQQLAYAGARVWGRRHTPETLMGLLFEGETIDVTPSVIARPATPLPHDEPAPEISAPAVPVEPPATERYDPETGEVLAETKHAVPGTLKVPPGNEGWADWCQQLVAHARGAQTLDEVQQWLDLNVVGLNFLKAEFPKMHRSVERAVEGHKLNIAQTQGAT
jgi:hypothetical protein